MSKNTSNVSKQNYVTTGQYKGGKPVAIKEHQAGRMHHMNRVITDVMAPAPNENSLTNGAQIKYYLEADTLRHIQNVVLRFRVRIETANGVLVPTPYWFNRIEFYIRKNGKEISRAYADNLMLLLTAVDQEQSDAWATLCGYDPLTYLGDGSVIVAGTTVERYLPLPANVLEGLGLDGNTMDSDIEIRLHPASAGPLDGALSAAGSVPKLLEVAGVYGEELPDAISDNASRSFLARHVNAHNYVDFQQYSIPSRTINASTKYEFDLDQFDHDSAGLILCILPVGASNATGDAQAYQSLGSGNLDVLGVSGESEFGGGRAVRADYLKNIVVSNDWPSSFIAKNNMYIIPFGDIAKALHGSVDGIMHFDGTKKRLEVTTPAGWTNGNYDVNIYSIYFRVIYQNGSVLTAEDH